ncbi:orotidine 5'-phosphate decarboxylase [Candidatus Actinomarina sp.]|nr:orotidine 5'-phosphate decarboxylase [Candidatus Actinomarina sp.]
MPNTVQAATISAGDMGADYLTIHIASGKEALLAAKESKSENLKLLGVSTALTSKAYSLEMSQKVYEQFLLAKESEIDGVICPPSELVKTKELFELIVTPGIRLKNEESHDQKNITTPEKAIRDGASYLVMGRSVRQNINYVVEKLKL